jgi:hypothetical protein
VYCLAEVVAAPRLSGQWREYYPIQPVRNLPLTAQSRAVRPEPDH